MLGATKLPPDHHFQLTITTEELSILSLGLVAVESFATGGPHMLMKDMIVGMLTIMQHGMTPTEVGDSVDSLNKKLHLLTEAYEKLND